MQKRPKGVSAKRREPLVPWLSKDRLSSRLLASMLEKVPEGRMHPGDHQYMEAIADAMAEYFTHGRQYENQWWKEKERILAAAFELKRKGVRMFNWSVSQLRAEAKMGSRSYDKPHSSALDAVNGAAFLAAGIRARDRKAKGLIK